jgi:hypothetical protein
MLNKYKTALRLIRMTGLTRRYCAYSHAHGLAGKKGCKFYLMTELFMHLIIFWHFVRSISEFSCEKYYDSKLPEIAGTEAGATRAIVI